MPKSIRIVEIRCQANKDREIRDKNLIMIRHLSTLKLES